MFEKPRSSTARLDFLPRGGGVVTRRPLELRLVHLNTQDVGIWGTPGGLLGDSWGIHTSKLGISLDFTCKNGQRQGQRKTETMDGISWQEFKVGETSRFQPMILFIVRSAWVKITSFILIGSCWIFGGIG